MKALLLIAHGSRKSASNDEIRELAAQIQIRGNRKRDKSSSKFEFELVEHAFLEMAEPTIAQGATTLITQGATDITLFPYFLAAGQHVAMDIPAQVETLRQQHPTLAFTIAPHIGAATNMWRLIDEHLQTPTQ